MTIIDNNNKCATEKNEGENGWDRTDYKNPFINNIIPSDISNYTTLNNINNDSSIEEHIKFHKDISDNIYDLENLYDKVDDDWKKLKGTNNNSNCNYKLIKEEELADGHKPGTSNAYLGNEKDDAVNEWKEVCVDDVGHGGKYYFNGYYKSYNTSSLNYLNCRSKKIFNNIDGIGEKNKTPNYIEYLNDNIDKILNITTSDETNTTDNINNYLTEKKQNKEYGELHLLIDDLKKQKIIEFVYYIGGISMITLFIINQISCKK
jgi:hypothetical protein